ncbi:hypothetical protein ACFQAS_01770 [Halopenitus salinus]|jgi:hypothetical protein|uniref:Cardiolipin synthase N-terminal domain-containing protein n=1 Tax=Halopenitus salinus TaxID=1198295 RepID=A0ABD5UTK7_9EURY
MPLLQGVPVGPELLIIFIVTGIFLIPALVVTALIYRDAKERNSSHTLAWALGAFFGGIIVWILYFVVRDEVGTGSRSASNGT